MKSSRFKALVTTLLTVVFLAPSLIFAAEESDLATGITFARAGEYRKAIPPLRKAVETAPDNTEGNFYLGVALNRLADKEAETVLKKSLLQTPENPYVNFELGVFYFTKEIDAEAADYFENVLALTPNGEYATQARAYLKRIEEKGGEKSWEINLLTGLQYDSNVIVIGDGPLPAGVSQQSDWVGLVSLRGNYSLIKNTDLELTAGYSLYQTLHTRLDGFDVTQNLFDLSLLHGIAPNIKVKAAYSFEQMLLGDHRYDYAHVVAPSLLFNFAELGSTTIDYKFRKTAYKNFGAFKTNTDRNGDNHYVGITHIVPMDKSYSVWGGYSHDEDLTQAGFWDYHGDRVAAGLRASLPYNSMVDLSAEYYHKKYAANDPTLHGDVRSDSQYMVSATLMKILSPTFTVMAMEQYTRNRSNIGTFDYVRAVTSLFINARF